MYGILRALLFCLKPETAHRLATRSLDLLAALPGGAWLLRRVYRCRPRPIELFGQAFANPVGLAAGFDKDARHLRGLAALGFGFLEVGSVTARPSAGNAQPRLFRLPADNALINRMGLNNAGAEATATRLARGRPAVPLFINVAKTHDQRLTGESAIADYVASVTAVSPHADVLVLNVSCPNAGDGRTFEDPDALQPLLAAVLRVSADTPLVLKLSPDLPEDDLRAVIELADRMGVAGYTMANTTVVRDGLKTPPEALEAIGPGGLSGEPLRVRACAQIALLRGLTDKPLIAVGGIATAEHAQAALDAGANLVQLYTGFVYGGPATVKRICAGLTE